MPVDMVNTFVFNRCVVVRHVLFLREMVGTVMWSHILASKKAIILCILCDTVLCVHASFPGMYSATTKLHHSSSLPCGHMPGTAAALLRRKWLPCCTSTTTRPSGHLKLACTGARHQTKPNFVVPFMLTQAHEANMKHYLSLIGNVR